MRKETRVVQLTVRLTAASGHAHQLVDALHSVMQHGVQRGYSHAYIAADVDEANAFWYVEDWQDETALEGELGSERFSQLLALVETSAAPPILEFRIITEARGLEYVSAVREGLELIERHRLMAGAPTAKGEES
jgi:quinol monooxygenase YgiN